MDSALDIKKYNFSSLCVSREEVLKWNELHFEFFKNFSSKHTQKCYMRDIKQFYKFLDINIPNLSKFDDVRRIHLVAYRDFLMETGQAPKTVCRKFSSLSSYFDFLVEKEIFEINPCSSIKRPSQSAQRPTNDLSDLEVAQLFEVVDRAENPMHKALIYLLFYTGVRKQELINICPCDFEHRDGVVLLHIIGKGKKQLMKVIDSKVYQLIEAYWESLANNGFTVEQNGPAFMPTRNPKNGVLQKRLNPKSVDYIFKKYCHKAGIFRRVSPHSARASYIGSALENGANLLHVSQDVGHSSVKTTQEYNKRRQKIKDSPVNHLGYKQEKKSA